MAWLDVLNPLGRVEAGLVIGHQNPVGQQSQTVDLARHLASLLGNLPERMKKQELVDQAQKTLDEVAGLMENMGSTPETQRPVLLKIHEATESLVKAILLSSVNPLAKSSAVKTSPTSTPNLISTNAQGGKP